MFQTHSTKLTHAFVATTLMMTSCASQPDKIEPKYVSPIIYQNFQCGQLIEEKTRLSREVDRVSGLQRENATGDAVMLTVGLIILWPVLIGMAATKDRKDELGKLKGEYEAVDAQARMKQCPAATSGIPARTTDAPPAPLT